MLDPQKRDTFLTYLPEDQKVQGNDMYLRGLRSVYEFKAGAASSTLPTTRIARLELGLLLGFCHSHARSRKRSTLSSRMEEELVVPSPSAPGFARQLLSDIVDVERRVLYEIMPKSDLTFGMVKSEDGRNRFNIIEFWRTREPRYPLAFPVYSALPTEANCERVFSRIGNKTQDTVHIGDSGLLLEQPQ